MRLTKSKLIFSTTTAAFLVLAGCMDEDGTRNNTANYGAIGTAVGAAAGAGISNYLNDRDCDEAEDEEECRANNNAPGAIAGAGIGGIIGAGIGAQLDQQEEELQGALSGTGVTITNTGDRLIVTLPEAITFPVDSSAVKPSLYPALAELANSANKYPNEIVQIVGHTDNTGSDSYNQSLSERRASAVAQILIQNGLPANRAQTIGMGESAPIASNETEQGRQANRRVEINLIPQQ